MPIRHTFSGTKIPTILTAEIIEIAEKIKINHGFTRIDTDKKFLTTETTEVSEIQKELTTEDTENTEILY